MTIRFAAANTGARASRLSPASQPVARALAARSIERASNDNASLSNSHGLNDQVLQAALRLFAQHGFEAARIAQTKAQAAVAAKDQQAYDWWLGITRTLDRKMANQVEASSPKLA